MTHKNSCSPSEFARLGFSCLIQSALDDDLYLRAPQPSHSSSSSIPTSSQLWMDSDLLSVAPLHSKPGEERNHDIAFEWFVDPSEEKGFFHLLSATDSKRPLLLHLGENFEQNGDPISIVEKNHAFENTKLRFDEVPGKEGCYFMTFHKAANMGSRTTDSKRVVHVDEETRKQVTLFEKSQSPSCYWRFVPTRLTPADLVDRTTNATGCCFSIENKAGGGFLNLKGGSIFNGTQVSGGPFLNQPHFKWKIKPAGSADHYFIISARDAHHDRALQQHENLQDDNAKITLWEIDPTKDCKNAMVKFEPSQEEGGSWAIMFCHSNKYLQLRLGELSQVGKKRNQPLDPSCYWTFVRCIPGFPKNA